MSVLLAAAMAGGALGALLPTATAAAQNSSPATSVTSAADKSDERPDPRAPLTPEQVKAEMAEADRLRAQLTKENAEAAEAAAKLDAATEAAAEAMEKLATARRALAEATAEEEKQRTKLRQLTAAVNKAKKDVDNMAVDAYTNGTGSLSSVAALMRVLTGSSDELSGAALASYLADSREADRAKYAQLAAEQQKAATAASEARLAREKATEEADAASKATEQLVADQQAAVAELRVAAARTAADIDKSEAAIAAAKQAEKDRAGAAARAARLAADSEELARAQAARSRIDPATATCGDDVGYYPNGQHPASALCQLETARGHMLRPGAAQAFDAMSRAYQKDTGSLLCITDSYRTLASQIDVKRRKPTLAAKPGTSNHGLGLAVDLCGGVESFGTAAHAWMKQNAPAFGFFHPAWAGPTGSKPEPWHWEYAG